MKKIIFAAALILGTTLIATASDQKKLATGPAQQGPLALKTPFKVWIDGQYIFVENDGATDWTYPLDVSATCTPVGPTTSCGSTFPGGKFSRNFATFPAGHNQAPQYGRTSGAGWIAVSMGLPYGTFKITARAANNYSPETNITLSAPVSPLRVNPATIQLLPTKTP